MNSFSATAIRSSGLGAIAALLLLSGCQSSYLALRDAEIRKATAAIAAAKTDAQRAAGYADRADAYADKSRYSRIMKLIDMDAYTKMFDLAMQDYAQALTLEPANARTYSRRGSAYYSRASLDMIYDRTATAYLTPARADFSKSLELNSKDVQTLDMLGLTDASLQHWTEAIADFEKEAALAPNSQYRLSDAYCNRGDEYLGKGKYDLAEADLVRSIEMGNRGDACECDPYNSLLTVYLTKTHESGKALELAAKAKAAGKWIAPDHVEQLKATQGPK